MVEKNQKEESDMSAAANLNRPCTVLESIEKSCKEVKLMREGKIPKRSWNDFKKQIENEITEDK